MDDEILEKAARALKKSSHSVVFTGAGISVESGVPPFRGADGLWSRYDPAVLELGYFRRHPAKSWEAIKKIFYESMASARPNAGHEALARLEQNGRVRAVITQNIDGLHQAAGSREVYEFHGSVRYLDCLECGGRVRSTAVSFEVLPPPCASCGGVLKPSFVFFGERIPAGVLEASFQLARRADFLLVVGTSAEVMPAAQIPQLAKEAGATIVEVNVGSSPLTATLTDFFLEGPASVMLPRLAAAALRS